MAHKEWTIQFGGRERAIHCTSLLFAQLQRRLGFRSGAQWLVEDVLGVSLSGDQVSNGTFNVHARLLLLSGLLATAAEADGARRRRGREEAYTPDRIAAWYDEAAQAGALKEVLWQAVACCYASAAVTGEPVDFDQESGVVRVVFFARGGAAIAEALEAFYQDDEATGGDPDAPAQRKTKASAAPSSVATAAD